MIAVLKGVPEPEQIVQAIVKYKEGNIRESGYLRGVATFYRNRNQHPELLKFLGYVLRG